MKIIDKSLMSNSLPVCTGTGLVALDVIISAISNSPTQFLAGGSCGNVMAILSYLGWSSHPISRLSNNVASELLIQDLKAWNVHDDLIDISETGSTPIIIHRIMKDQAGAPKHRFEFRNPEDGKYLPMYKPCLAKSVDNIFNKLPNPNLFYFDRVNRGALDLAKAYKSQGAIIFFEPSSFKDEKQFRECLSIADVIKFSNDRISNYSTLFPTGQVKLEIETLGNEGLQFRQRGYTKWTKLSAYSIDNVVDSAGAGDWCSAGIISNLFKNKGIAIEDIKTDDLIYAMQFGQALSALNCTFEGARGLMYNITRADLMLYIQHIVTSHSHKIHNQKKHHTSYHRQNFERKISSLFASV